MHEDSSDVSIVEDFGHGSKKEKRSFKNIVLKQYELCCTEGSKEMTTGGVRKRIIDGEEVVTEVVPNQIEIFCNSVDMLKYLLYPQVEKHAAYIGKKINTFEDNLKEIARSREKIMSQIKEKVEQASPVRRPADSVDSRDENLLMSDRERYIEIAKRIQERQNILFESRKYNLHKELLGHLGFLMAKLNYFEESGAIG